MLLVHNVGRGVQGAALTAVMSCYVRVQAVLSRQTWLSRLAESVALEYI